MSFINTFALPPTDEERERAVELSGFFFEKKWTAGQAKRAFALWYERLMRETGAPTFILESDLSDFAQFLLKVHDSGG